MAYQNARGINAEEIVIDGDDFVSPTTSHGPEELVPGQLLDSVNIKVYDRTVDGGSVIQNYNYTYEGSYTLSQVKQLSQVARYFCKSKWKYFRRK